MEKSQVKVRNRRLTPTEFSQRRAEVLGLWPTGQEVDLDEGAAYLKSLPSNKSVPLKVREAKEKGHCLSQPRGGFPLLEDMINLHQTLERQGDPEILLPVNTDSYTRAERFSEVAQALQMCYREKRSVLNGYPTVNHGVKNNRLLQESTSRPLYALGGNPLPCLTAEISFASGFTGFLGSGVCVPMGYSKYVSIEQCIKNYQYVDFLTSLYGEQGALLYRETAGFLTWVLIPPGVEIALNTIDVLLAAEQGVKLYGLSHSSQVNFLQDTAAIMATREVAGEYLAKCGHADLELFTSLIAFGGTYPENPAMAYATTALVAAAAGMAGVQGVSVKTVDEAKAVPTVQNNALATLATRQALAVIGKNRYPPTPDLVLEVEMLKKEAHSIIDRVLEMGEGDVAVGAVLAFEHGILDCPWSPNMCVKGKVLGARDHAGIVRYLDAGNMPIPKEVLDYHRQELNKRAKKENRLLDYEMVLDDLLKVAQGRPLSD
jgi:methylaspartate mutase epsilon subunit